MKQLTLLEHETKITIPGLQYIADYIDSAEEASLLKIIDDQIWLSGMKRRVQHYGYKYDYRTRAIDNSQYLGALPEWLNSCSRKLSDDEFFEALADQVIINEYIAGQGISAHIDCTSCFADTICSLSLGSSCVMNFTCNTSKVSILLEPRSLIVLSGDARYLWKHSISARKYDNYLSEKLSRTRRISLTFRKVINTN